jgi:hypothetical protein
MNFTTERTGAPEVERDFLARGKSDRSVAGTRDLRPRR